MPKQKNSNSLGQIECSWGHLVSLSSIDQERNNISLFNIIEQFNFTAEQLKQLQNSNSVFSYNYEIILSFRRLIDFHLCDNELNTDIKITQVDPKGNSLFELLVPIKFEAGKKGARLRIQNDAMKISGPGDYVYKVEIRQPENEEFSYGFEITYLVLEK